MSMDLTWWSGAKLHAFSLYMEGKRAAQIADAITADVTAETVRRWMRHEQWKLEESRCREEITTQIKTRQINLATESLEKVYTLMQEGTNHDRVQLEAALAILQRAMPIEKNAQEAVSGVPIKVIVVNQNRVDAVKAGEMDEFEKQLGYDGVKVPDLVRRDREMYRITEGKTDE